jgi:PhoPQ-activated pathogenicity-related protein
MNRRLALISLFFLSVVANVAVAEDAAGPLAQYVAKEDDSYQWVKTREGTIGATSYVELILTSQTWQGITWRHQLYILKPSTMAKDSSHCLLLIGGGNWRDELAKPASDDPLPGEARLFAAAAETLKTPVAIVLQVPNQPLFGGLVEDQLISLTFERYLKAGEAEHLLLLPMVKSAVRAMDAVEECAKKEWSIDVKTFTVTGASKRGWTTWLTGATDRRATAIAPMVIDMLSMDRHLEHQLTAWGNYSHMIGDYTRRGLPEHIASPRGKSLRAIVDPYSYRKQLTQPKLLMIGTNDPYWPLDSLNLYWNDLVGPKYILYVPNNGHGLRDAARVFGTLNALNQHAANGKTLPKLSWKFDVGAQRASLRITSDQMPKNVRIWAATSPTRDFRKAQWKPYPTKRDGDAYVCELDIPKEGHGAMFGEATYEMDGIEYFLSTNVRIAKTP